MQSFSNKPAQKPYKYNGKIIDIPIDWIKDPHTSDQFIYYHEDAENPVSRRKENFISDLENIIQIDHHFVLENDRYKPVSRAKSKYFYFPATPSTKKEIPNHLSPIKIQLAFKKEMEDCIELTVVRKVKKSTPKKKSDKEEQQPLPKKRKLDEFSTLKLLKQKRLKREKQGFFTLASSPKDLQQNSLPNSAVKNHSPIEILDFSTHCTLFSPATVSQLKNRKYDSSFEEIIPTPSDNAMTNKS